MRKVKKEGIKFKLFIVALASFLMLVFCIGAASPDSTLRFIDPTPANYTQEQDFTWGVLAINTHKSIYLPNETAFIGIAVLDNEGHMICDADVTLTITDPSNNETVLSTGNGLINVSPQCCVYGVTNLPDYYTNYTVGGVGTYVINLTAVTADGTKSITDVFTVQNSVDFEVARDGATRIYPSVPYVMNFTIKANKNYTGLIREYVPASFVITPQDGLIVTTVGDTKVLTWTKNLVAGETYNIYYEFDAPDVSPYLFLLGRLQIGSFKEKRDWMIASDATTVETKAPNACDSGWSDCVNANAADTTFASTSGSGTWTGQWYDYGFPVPTGATINSVKVKIKSYVGNAAQHSISLEVSDGTSWGSSYLVTATETDCTEQVIDVSNDFSWTAAMVNGIKVKLTATIGGGAAAKRWTRCCYLPVEVNYDYTPTWASEHETYDSTNHIVHMTGGGFKLGYVYKVGYYDGTEVGGGDQVCVECGGTSTAEGGFSSQFECMSSGATYGTWHSVVFDTTESLPATYNAIVDYVIDDGFTVQESAIPEFPTVIAAVAVCMLCAVAYVVMRRRSEKG
jgi:hypothetical protein